MNSHRSGHQHPICIERGEVSLPLSPALRCAHLLLLRRQQNGAAPGGRFAPWTAQLQLFFYKDDGDEGHEGHGIQGFFLSLFGSRHCGKQMCLGWHSSLPLRYWTLMQRIENWRCGLSWRFLGDNRSWVKLRCPFFQSLWWHWIFKGVYSMTPNT